MNDYIEIKCGVGRIFYAWQPDLISVNGVFSADVGGTFPDGKLTANTPGYNANLSQQTVRMYLYGMPDSIPVDAFNRQNYDDKQWYSLDLTHMSHLTSIDTKAFYNCINSNSNNGYWDLYLPNSLQTISSYAFMGSTKLRYVYFGTDSGCQLTSIGAHAFDNCYLSNVQCYATDAPVIQADTFQYTQIKTKSNLYVYVPQNGTNYDTRWTVGGGIMASLSYTL